MNDDSKHDVSADQLPDLSEVPELQLEEVSGGRLLRSGPPPGMFPPKPIGWWFPDAL